MVTEKQARVLLLGHDQTLLDIRASVLTHFWLVATALMTRSVVPARMADIVVLCHTIPEEERWRWLERTRAQFPEMIVVKMNGYDSGAGDGLDRTVSTGSGPGALVSTIYELLTERGLASKGWPNEQVWRMDLDRPSVN